MRQSSFRTSVYGEQHLRDPCGNLECLEYFQFSSPMMQNGVGRDAAAKDRV